MEYKKKMVEHDNKLNQLEEEKEQLRNEMVHKTNLMVFQLDRQEQYIRRENILIYRVEEDKEDNDDGAKILFKIADEPEIDLQVSDIQRVHRLGQKRRNKENPRPIIARFVPYKKRNEFLTNIRYLKKLEGRQHVFLRRGMYWRHQPYTLYYRHVCILVFLHVFVCSLLLRCMSKV